MSNLTPEARELAAQAAQILIDGGWQQKEYGDFKNPEAPHCLMGALFCIETFLDEEDWTIKNDLKQEILRRVKWASVVEWNDFSDRTQEEVVGLLQDIAEGR